MTSVFQAKKAKILEQLSTPTQDYTDASPKGSVDAPVQTLVKEINDIESLVTTSSCSGRIAIYIEGYPSVARSSQGKGGGSWLFVSHTPLDEQVGQDASTSLFSQLLSSPQNESHVSVSPQMQTSTDLNSAMPSGTRLLHFKFEPLILHILCSSLWAARKVLIASQAAGFRESGISSVPEPARPTNTPTSTQAESTGLEQLDGRHFTEREGADVARGGKRQYPKRERKSQKQTLDGPVMVAVRTTGLAIDAPVGYLGEDDNIKLVVSDAYLSGLVRMGNQRFATNEERKQRLRNGIMQAFRVDD
ncbi:hypothetical protein KVT40_003360 [Elsinoe batatas]|uniref:tRNA(Phe) 7-[(3-amino-3-carboxypropyl)-4-demethylwyosine(37)-N(4)]-methyltransferase n=1 Tax=Elsinoe batatas TaxID=2601811 RepID=A0A8K0L5Z0_9PEZI|nr:hypothetical protein KVT40_003360 [Elsinoe batatas]